MLVSTPPAQPAVPLAQVALVRKVDGSPGRHRLRVGARTPGVRRKVGHWGVYRPAGASWYGGGGGLACGGTLTSSTQGVANKTLPCGTLLALRYHGRKVVVRVIDRGPYVAGRDFDLTEATKRALGFGDTGQVWWSLHRA